MSVFLREICKKDIPAVNRWRNDKRLSEYLCAPFRYSNLEGDKDWFANYMRNRNTNLRCAICLKRTKKIIGVVYLTSIDLINRSAEFSIMLGERDYQNKGIGTVVTRMMLEHAFLNLNLNRIFLVVQQDNNAGIRCYEKNGFRKEGVLREALYKKGGYKDLVLMCVLRKYFQPLNCDTFTNKK